MKNRLSWFILTLLILVTSASATEVCHYFGVISRYDEFDEYGNYMYSWSTCDGWQTTVTQPGTLTVTASGLPDGWASAWKAPLGFISDVTVQSFAGGSVSITLPITEVPIAIGWAIGSDSGGGYEINVDYTPNPAAPLPVISATPTSGNVPLAVQFSGAGSTPPSGATITSYAWDFMAEGTASGSGISTSYTYVTGGRYGWYLGYHHVRLTVTSSNGVSTSTTRKIMLADVTPPGKPQKPYPQFVGPDFVSLQTLYPGPSDDFLVVGYKLYCDGVFVAYGFNNQSLWAGGLTPGTQHSFTVKALDWGNNLSIASDPLVLTTTLTYDTSPPSVPSNLTASNIGNTSFTLNWGASTDNNGVLAYEVFRGSVSLGETASLSMDITGLTAGNTYAMAVVARDAAYNRTWTTPLTVTTTNNANVAPIITGHPSGATISAFQNVTLSAAATGTPSPTWQWKKDGVLLSNGGRISGATTAGLQITNTIVADAGNYVAYATNTAGVAATNSAALVVNKAAASVTVGSLAQTYNKTARSATASTNPAGLSVTFTYSGNSTPPTNAGTYAVIGTVSDPNYAGSGPGNLIISQAALSVGGVAASNKTYDGTTNASPNFVGATLNGVFAGDSVSLVTSGATAVFASKIVGTGKSVSVSGLTTAGSNAGNYYLVQPSTTANISPRGLIVSGITASNKPYDGSTSATINTSGASLSGVVGGDSVTLNLGSASGSFANATSGAGKTVNISGLSISGGDSGNYALTQPTTTANITQINTAFSLTATNFTYNGTGKAVSVISTPSGATFTTGGTTSATNPGSYVATASANGNYSGSNSSLTWTISKATQTIAFAALSDRTLGQPAFSLSATSDSGLPISFNIVSGPATLSTNNGVTSVAATGTGAVTIRASQSGNGFYFPATDVDRTFLVTADLVQPSVPAGQYASGVGVDAFTLNWTNSTDNVGVTGYEVQLNGIAFAVTQSTNCAVTGLQPATQYSLAVRAKDAAGNWSNWSDAISVTTSPDTFAPSVPGGFSRVNPTTTSFRLSWTSSTDNVGIAAYEVRTENGDSLGVVQITSIDLAGLNPATTYNLQARAVDTSGNWSSWSPTYSAATLGDTSAPTIPTGLTAPQNEQKPTYETLHWNSSADDFGVVGYDICISLAGAPTSAPYATTTGTSYVLAGLTPNTAYYVKIRAKDAAGNVSGWTDEIFTVTPKDYPYAPSRPIFVDLSGDGIRDEIIAPASGAVNYNITSWSYETGVYNFYFEPGNYWGMEDAWSPEGGYFPGFEPTWNWNYWVYSGVSTIYEVEATITMEPGEVYAIYVDTSENSSILIQNVLRIADNITRDIGGWTSVGLGTYNDYELSRTRFYTIKYGSSPSTFSISGGASPTASAGVSKTALSGGSVSTVLASAVGGLPVDVTLTGSLVLKPLDILGKALGKSGHQTVWTVLNAAGIPLTLPKSGLLDALDLGVDLKGRIRVGVRLDNDDHVYWADINIVPPMEKKVANGDIWMLQWQSATDRPLNEPVYAGDSNGDMVSWTVQDFLPGNYTWSATGPYFNGAITLPDTIQGPSGNNVREWRIARAGNSTGSQTEFNWKPGTYKIKCYVERPIGGNYTVEYYQQVGWRSRRYFVVGQVRPMTDFSITTTQQAALRSDLISDIDDDCAQYAASTSPAMAPLWAAIPVYARSAPMNDLLTLWFVLNGGPSTTTPPPVTQLPHVGQTERYWMVQTIFNLNPDLEDISVGTTLGGSNDTRMNQLYAKKSYRMLSEYGVKYLLDDNRKLKLDSIKPVDEVRSVSGPTKLRWPGFLSWLSGFQGLAGQFLSIIGGEVVDGNIYVPPDDSPYTRTQHKDVIGGRISLYTSARVGLEGRFSSYRLFGHDVPYIFNEITIGLDSEGRDRQNTIPVSLNRTWSASTADADGNYHFNEIRIYERRNGQGTYDLRYTFPLGGGAGMLQHFVTYLPSGAWNLPAPLPLVPNTQ